MKGKASDTIQNSALSGTDQDSNETFSVWTEPWIPVRWVDGRTDLLSMRDVLAKAPQLSEITDNSPLVEYGLYRLLITLLMDALRPDRKSDHIRLLRSGLFDMSALEKYVSDCEARGFSFDLFDPDHPFLQTRYNSAWDKTPKPANSLDYTLPHGQNHVHFRHENPDENAYTYAEAAQMLPALQLFCTAGLQGPSGVNASPPYFTIVRGENLFETLVLSMIPVASVKDFDSEGPWWRNDTEVEPKKEMHSASWLMGMLYPARRILLVPEGGVIRQVYMGAGLNYSLKDTWVDPHVAYVPQKDKKGNVLDTRAPWRPRLDAPVWLNIEQLVSRKMQAAVVSNLQGEIADVQMYGVQTQQAKYVDSMRFEVLIPMRLADNDIGRMKAMRCVEDARDIANALRHSLSTGDQKKGGNHSAHVSAPTIDTAVWEYYGRCEAALWDMLSRLADVSSNEEANDEHIRWLMHCKRSAMNVYDDVMNAGSVNGRSLIELTKRRNSLAAAINRCMPEEEQADQG